MGGAGTRWGRTRDGDKVGTDKGRGHVFLVCEVACLALETEARGKMNKLVFPQFCF